MSLPTSCVSDRETGDAENPSGGSFSFQPDRAGEPVLADHVDAEGVADLLRQGDAGRARRATRNRAGGRRSEPVAVGLAAASCDIAHVDAVTALAGSIAMTYESAWCVFKPGARVFVVVVERQQLAVGSGELDEGIERGIKPQRGDFRHDRVAGSSREFEDIPVIRAVDVARWR